MSSTIHTTPAGARIAYLEKGRGSPLLLVHGSLCDYRFWQPQFEVFARAHRVIAVSLPHYHPVEEQSVSFDSRAHIEALASLIDARSDTPVHLLGHSRGGSLAARLAIERPERVATLILAEPGGARASVEHAIDADQIGGDALASAPSTRGEDGVASAHWLAAVLALLEEGRIDAALERFVDSVSRPGTWQQTPPPVRSMMRDNALTIPLQARETMPGVSAEEARSLALPTLLVAGERSPARFHAVINALAAWLPNNERETIPGASHGMNLAHPRAFNQAVLNFLARQR